MKLIQNKETGIVEAWENGCKIGEVIGMGDDMGMAVDTASMPDQNGKKIVEERYRMLGAIGVKYWGKYNAKLGRKFCDNRHLHGPEIKGKY